MSDRYDTAPMSDWDALNAYVDGMLAPDMAAEIAARISREPALARQAAALMRLKASTAAAFDADGFVPAVSEPVRQRRTRRAALITAAAITLLAVASLAIVPRLDTGGPAWLSAAVMQHATMSAQTATDGAPTLSRVAALADFQPYIPDLAAARLRAVVAAPFHYDGSSGGPAGIALHFRGTRGCKVSYFAFALSAGTPRLGEMLGRIETEGASGFGWRVGDIGYLLIVRGMDDKRLTTLAKTIHMASRRHRSLDDAARSVLAQSRANSRACAV